MTWTLKFNDDWGMVDLVLKGHVSGPEIHEASSASIAMLKEHHALVTLIDTSGMESAPPIADIYELPTKQYIQEELSYDVRCALVVPESSKVSEATRFYETVCVNRGWHVRSFPARDKAIDWLTGKAPSNSASDAR